MKTARSRERRADFESLQNRQSESRVDGNSRNWSDDSQVRERTSCINARSPHGGVQKWMRALEKEGVIFQDETDAEGPGVRLKKVRPKR
jgi:hypothetical protein